MFLPGMKEKPKLNKKFHIIIAAIVIIIVVLVVSAVLLLASTDKNKPTTTINQAACQSSGGSWNECGSLCLDQPPGTLCPAVCVPQCEWYASSAEAVRSRSTYSSQQGFSCITQPNGILLCWLREENVNQSGLVPI